MNTHGLEQRPIETGDHRLVHSSWLGSARDNGMSCNHRDIDDALRAFAGISVCHEETPWVVYAWIVYDGQHLKYVYVKDGVRRCGIGMWLLFSAFGGRVFNPEAHTKAGDALVRKYDAYRYSGEAESLRDAYREPRERVEESVAGRDDREGPGRIEQLP